MPATYEPIATVTLGSATNVITFSSIPTTYTDLRFVFNGRNSANSHGSITFNNSGSGNYAQTHMRGDGSTVDTQTFNTTSNFNGIRLGLANYSSSIPTLVMVDIMNYRSSRLKQVLASISSDKNGSGFIEYLSGFWNNTSAITTLSFTTFTGDWSAGSRATLYGIKAA